MTLLLRPGGTWSGTLRWDGYVYANGTAPAGGASAAAAGTYKGGHHDGGRARIGSAVVDVTLAHRFGQGAVRRAQSGAQSGR